MLHLAVLQPQQLILRYAGQHANRPASRILSSIARAPRSPSYFSRRHFQSSIPGQQAQVFNDSPRRSILVRTSIWLVGALTFTTLGIYIGLSTLPTQFQWRALLAPQPTDAETLSPEAYIPPDEASARINAHILNHPLAQALRAKSDFTESRPHLKIPAAIRDTNLTGGTLAGPGRIVVPPLQFAHQKGESYVSIFYLGPQLCGHPGIIHGGLLATLLDEGLARCCFPALPSGVGVTANLKIDYRKPVRADGYFVLRAKTVKVEGRKAWVTGWIENLGEGDEEVEGGAFETAEKLKVKGVDEGVGSTKGQMDKGKKLVEAEALFIEPRNAHLIKRIYQP